MFTQFITEEEEEAVLPVVCVSPEADHNFYNLTATYVRFFMQIMTLHL